MSVPSSNGQRNRHAGTEAVEPGKDHYVRANGKLLGILLASLYPTEWDLEQARSDYERGVGAPVELSSRRSGQSYVEASEGEEGAGP